MSSPVSRSCGRGLREARAQRGEVQQRHESAVGAGHGRGPRQSRRPAARQSPASYSTDSASSTSRQSRRPPSSTSTPVSVRASGQTAAVEQRAQVHQRQDPSADRRRRRGPPAPRAGTGKHRAGVEHLDDLIERKPDQPAAGAHQQVPSRRRRAHRAAIRPSSSPTRPAIRPTGSTWLHAAGLHRRVRHAEDRRGLAVLRDPDAAGVVDRAQPVGAVAAEAGQHDADGARAEDPGDAAEQRIGRGPHAPDRWAPGRARAAVRRRRRRRAYDNPPAPRTRCPRGAACRAPPRPR